MVGAFGLSTTLIKVIFGTGLIYLCFHSITFDPITYKSWFFLKKFSNTYILVLPLVCFILGIAFQYIFPLPIQLIVVISILMSTLFILLHYLSIKPLIKMAVSLLLFFFAGSVIYQYDALSYESLLQTFSHQPITLYGVITERSTDIGKKRTFQKQKESFRLHIDSVHFKKPNSLQSYSFDTLCYAPSIWPLQVGDRVQITNVSIENKKDAKTLLGESTFHRYLTKEKILTSLFIKRDQVYLISRPLFSLSRFFHLVRESVYIRLKNKINSLSFGYFSSLFLGNKKDVQIDDAKNAFSFWGISHYLARSGLHIVLFIYLWRSLLQTIPLYYLAKQAFLLLLCILYYLFSWESISFLRALSVFLLYQIGILAKQQVNAFHLLCIICLLTLLINPLHLFFLDFQLSFVLTFALLWIVQISNKQKPTHSNF